MNGREAVRRGLVWASVVGFVVAGVFSLSRGSADWVSFAAFPVVGAIILTSRPGHGVGRFLVVVGLYWTLTGWVNPDLGRLPTWVEALSLTLAWPGWMALPLIGLLFPTGRIETRLGRTLVRGLAPLAALCTVIALVDPHPLPSGRANPFGLSAAQTAAELLAGPVFFLPFLAVIVGVLVDLLLRLKASSGARRLQYRWLFFGLATAIAFVAVAGAANAYLPETPLAWAATVLGAAGTNLIPVSIAIAITRHGLYEIGRVISRTVSYAVVTAGALAAYAVVVTAISQLAGGQTSYAVAVATLVAAAVLLPALRWVQRLVDRRFDRERYDAAGVVDAFGEKLRTSVDPDQTAADLVAAAERTLQPSAVGVWTIGGAR